MPKTKSLIISLIFLVCASLLLAVTSGTMSTDLVGLFHQSNPLLLKVILELRLPRAIAAVAVGGMLALSGVLLQILLRNPLADPYVLGLSGGAACGAILALLAGWSGAWTEGAALSGALLTMVLVFYLAHEEGNWRSARLLLTGVVVASGWGAVVTFLLVVTPTPQLKGVVFWLMGDMSHAEHPFLAILILALGLLIIWPLARSMNLLARGELQAASLGVHLELVRITLFLVASILTAVAVTTAGSIGFIGLIIPHLLRLLGCTDHRVLLPATVLLGSGLLLLADTLARTLVAPQQIPVGVVTAMIGVPIFLVLLQRGRI